uniref:Ribosomal protein L19 n=1 Tax=Pedobesia claviformis TaxID=2364088 RepID=A0A386B0U5_9CHLO|nr:ribosomal protein L19 [Pedobesia claviformis]AYC65315.1 ribosomal protein L19 [Pedobesia claviformis]
MSISKIISKFDQKHLFASKNKKVAVGSIIEMYMQFFEAEKIRVQKYSGLVIGEKAYLYHSSIRVRKLFQKIGIEIVFPLPHVQILDYKILKFYKLKRAKLYYLRNLGTQSSKMYKS